MKNLPIRVISPTFELLSEIDDYESLQFTRQFYKVGDFELHINLNKQNVDMLQEGNIIMLGLNTNKVGIILHRENSLDQLGAQSEELIIKGLQLKGILQRRLTIPDAVTGYDRINNKAEAVMKHYVNNNVINPVDTNRIIEQVMCSVDLQRGIQVPWQTRYEVLSDVLEQIGEWCQLGWDITLDLENLKWNFDVFEGRNLSADQDVLPPVIFSTDFENIKTQNFISSSINYKNVAYLGGSGDEVDRLIQQIGSFTGIDRIETFIDCSSAADASELLSQGEQRLNELGKTITFDVEVIPDGSFVYQTDYDLGDIVTVQSKKWGITLNSRIITLKEIYEPGGFVLQATLGKNKPTLLSILKKNITKIVR